MSYQIAWCIEGHIVRVQIEDELSSDEVAVLDHEMMQFLEQSAGPLVHFVFHIVNLKKYPSLKSLASMRAGRHTNMGWNIITGNINPMVKFLAGTASQVYRSRFQPFDTFEEAVAFLYKVDASLPQSAKT
jgi:hypothetical protein